MDPKGTSIGASGAPVGGGGGAAAAIEWFWASGKISKYDCGFQGECGNGSDYGGLGIFKGCYSV